MNNLLAELDQSPTAYCHNILLDQKRIVQVSCFVESLGACLSMPVVLGKNGIKQILNNFYVSGHGQAIINGESSDVYAQYLVFVPSGAEHNFKNIGDEELKLFTIYAPSQHKPGTIEKIKYE